MSHKIIYMGISAEEVAGDYSKEHIDSIVEKKLSRYVEPEEYEDEDEEEDEDCEEEFSGYKLDWYQIGGRWGGAFATLKGKQSAYPTENNEFATDTDLYDIACNDGKKGPYIIEGEEFIPVNGACKKDLDFTTVSKIFLYGQYKARMMLLNKDERVSEVQKDYEIDGDDLYTKDGHEFMINRNETFEDFLNRLYRGDFIYTYTLDDTDAYIDFDGEWHDMDELFGEILEKTKDIANISSEAYNAFQEKAREFVKSLSDDDYVIIIDGHSFP